MYDLLVSECTREERRFVIATKQVADIEETRPKGWEVCDVCADACVHVRVQVRTPESPVLLLLLQQLHGNLSKIQNFLQLVVILLGELLLL